MTAWRIEKQNNSYSLFKGRKLIDTFSRREDALDRGRKLMNSDDTLTEVAEDGYRTRLSPRKHWRQ